MKISAISGVQQKYNYVRNQNQQVRTPNFKSGGGALGTLGGVAVGVGITILTGGAAAPLIPLIGFGGAVTGEAVKENIDNKKRKP